MRVCPKCYIAKPLFAFHKNKGRPSGVAVWCKKCSSQYHKSTEARTNQQKYRNQQTAQVKQKNSLATRKCVLKIKYGLSLQDYDLKVKHQNNLCAICNNPETRVDGRTKTIKALSIDHDHKTGKVRSLLCSACNMGIGVFKEDIARLASAIAYLNEHAYNKDNC